VNDPVTLLQRRNGSWVLGCTLQFEAHQSYRPLARADAMGLWLWCRDCKRACQNSSSDGSEHGCSWGQILSVMEQLLPAEEFFAAMTGAARRVPAWRGDEE
jgi:hypothetical protein